MVNHSKSRDFHHILDSDTDYSPMPSLATRTKVNYNFYNHFHPFVQELLEQLNKKSLAGLFDADFQGKMVSFFQKEYEPLNTDDFKVTSPRKEFDLTEDGSYSIYNWELFFHIPLAIAVHLSKNQRFAEAQRWFHSIFDPTNTDQTKEPPMRYWNFLEFRENKDVDQISELLISLSDPKDNELRERVVNSINASLKNPFRPHIIARNRFLAYQFNVVMKYLDNLIAWGDSLFLQDTIETINEAMQLYVLAANILGPRPQEIPRPTRRHPRTYAMLRKKGKLDELGNALEEMEVSFPFNVYGPGPQYTSKSKQNPLFGTVKTLYFCIPPNEKLLRYWDTVDDRLFKVRHCMNIEGIIRQLPLFEPPIDPALLVKAVAAGIDISSIVSGLNQPLSQIRAPLLIQKALEICAEVKSLGDSLSSALVNKDAEKLALIRQEQEIKLLEKVQDTRFLQWKEASESIKALTKSRDVAYQKYRHYKYLLGNNEDDLKDIKDLQVDSGIELTEKNFNEVYNELVGKYDKTINLEKYPEEEQVGGIDKQLAEAALGVLGSIGISMGIHGSNLNLSKNEYNELNTFMPASIFALHGASIFETIAAYMQLIPNVSVDAKPFGIGGSISFGPSQIAALPSGRARILRIFADQMNFRANSASKVAGYFRRKEEWVLQSNLASRELVQIGRQTLSLIIREQIAQKEYENHKEQIENSRAIETFLKEQKYTNEEFYTWMQAEVSRIYYECYKFAFEMAKKAEQTMKHELMRNELDEMTFIKFNYWDSGRKGLLSGEALYLDIKKMEVAYHDYNKREYEITHPVSLQSLNPNALLQLKATGSCEITIPEWVLEMNCPGLFTRRLRTVSISLPCTVGPYASINCKLTLIKSTVRKSPLLKDGEFRRQGPEDDRFKDYFGNIESVITSRAQDDSGLFERNLRDERFLPFEGAGTESTWKVELPADFRQFDYSTISDVILSLSYTAREGGGQLAAKSVEYIKEIIEDAKVSGLARSFSLRHDFPNEWHKFVSSASSLSSSSSSEGAADTKMKITIKKYHFPYFAQHLGIGIKGIDIFAFTDGGSLKRKSISDVDLDVLNDGLNENDQAELEIAKDQEILNPNDDKKQQVFVTFSYYLYSLSEA
jgi:hypothetical protein